ncbi:metallophosphoesterase [Bacillus sp. ISL-47]|uniref:metallophosphoesterase n=1 Tax=Bacillus sp. ISL-47 TaxID=2819130 RepID=UPI001BE62D31|nr:metallophosphoesterase [Bacillus sp. ISL-47]MBT2687825.1 metallophosphoesterase [Bacillus sp. ISL-47]MBT2708098.1 metallophosphoesterase [Pseudomonas sp. ISL-84]
MPKKVSRRSFLKRALGFAAAAFGLSAGGYYYARDIETRLLDITNHKILNNAIPQAFNNVKIVQFSDTHLGFHYDLNQLEELIEKINNIKPDIIFFTGDLMDEPNKYSEANQIAPLLQNLEAPLGKFAIYGNHDHGGYGSDIYKTIMDEAGFILLLNENYKIDVSGSSIHVIGIDDAMLGRPDIKLAVENIEEDSYKILLSHAPDLADGASSFGIHLQLSGHSHGGQIKIPFFGALVKPPYAERYHEGFYKIGSQDPLTLYVNRGLGTTRLPFRFLSRPEMTVFTLHTDKGN